jgi:hypothetical protein
MKDIVLIYPKEHKSLTKKIVSKLESESISCWVAPRDFKQEEKDSVEKTIKESKLLLLIIDKNSVNNDELKQAVSISLENNVEVVPFVVEKIPSNLFTEFFFHKLSWIDAFDDSFDNAFELLLETYKDVTGSKPIQRKKTGTNNKNQIKIHPAVYVVASIVVLIVGYFIYNGLSDNAQGNPIVGKWSVSDYYDSSIKPDQDSVILPIEMLKKNGRLIFNADGSFERRGFSPEPQIGKWELNAESKILFLTPDGSTRKEIVNLDKLTESELVIAANETIGNQKVNTRITFTKQVDK